MRLSIRFCSVLMITTVGMSSVSRAGWNPDAVTVKSTTNWIALVDACTDGDFGTFVAWQEGSSASGEVRIQHLLPTGDLDPLWPADGALVCNVSTTRSVIDVVPDLLGGVYIWWLEGASFYMTRVESNGAIASGWPARGRLLGTLHPVGSRPSVISDGAHGIYAAWVAEVPFTPDSYRIYGVHLGPTNTGAGGWPNATRSLAPSYDVPTSRYGPSLALASDGGIFVAWATCGGDPLEPFVPNAWRLVRRTASGLLSAGWPADGIEVAPFHCEFYPEPPTSMTASPLAIDGDGRGGIFMAIADPTAMGFESPPADHLVFRLQGDGSNAPDWPVGGRRFHETWWNADVPGGDMRVQWDGSDGAYAGGPIFYTHTPSVLDLAHVTPSGVTGTSSGSTQGFEFVRTSTGVFVSDFWCCGPTSFYSPNAYISLAKSPYTPGANFVEWHDDPASTWFPGAGVASSGDGGAVFFWSQVRDRFGLFARRFGPVGQTTSVPASPATGLRDLRFVAGVGIRASWEIGEEGPSRLEIFDVSGRRVASMIAGGGAFQAVVPGTSALNSGLYLARLSSVRTVQSGRVLVTR